MRVFLAIDDTVLGPAIERRFASGGASTSVFAAGGDASSLESTVAAAARDGAPDVCVALLGAAAADADAGALESALVTSVVFARACVGAMLAGDGGTLLVISTPGATPAATALRAGFEAQFALNLRTDLHGSRVRVMTLQAGAALAPPASRLAGGLDLESRAPAASDGVWAAEAAETAWWLATRPAHVVVNALELERTEAR